MEISVFIPKYNYLQLQVKIFFFFLIEILSALIEISAFEIQILEIASPTYLKLIIIQVLKKVESGSKFMPGSRNIPFLI